MVKAAPRPADALSTDRAPVIANDPDAVAQAQPCAPTDLFHSKERVEYLGEDIFLNAGSIVGEGDAHIAVAAAHRNCQRSAASSFRHRLFSIGHGV